VNNLCNLFGSTGRIYSNIASEKLVGRAKACFTCYISDVQLTMLLIHAFQVLSKNIVNTLCINNADNMYIFKLMLLGRQPEICEYLGFIQLSGKGSGGWFNKLFTIN
jgi:hypothetical protein